MCTLFPLIYSLNLSPNISFLKKFNNRVLKIEHIFGADPLPCSKPCDGGYITLSIVSYRGTAQMTPPQLYGDPPQAVLKLYTIFYTVIIKTTLGGGSTSNVCMYGYLL